MRRLALSLALLLLPASVWAATICPPSMCAGNGYQTVHVTDRKPIAVVYDSDVLANTTDANRLRTIENENIGRLWTLLREQGQEVHFYESRYFQGTWGTADSLPYHLWHNMGDVYSLVICVGFRAQFANDPAFTRRFFCPDSTNAPLIHWSILNYVNDYSGAAPSGQLGTGTAVGTGYAGASNNATTGGGDGSNMAFLNSRGDSLFSIGANIGRAVYNYPNQPYAPQTFTGNVFGGYQFRSNTGSGAFSTIGNWGRIVVTSSSGGNFGTMFVQAHNDSVVFMQDSLGGTAGITNGTCTVAIYPPDSTHYRVSKTVRLWTPTWDAGGKFRSTSNNIVRADSANVMGADSVARYASEPLPIAWRVYWKPRNTALSWLSDPTSTSRSVDYVAMTGQVGSYACTAQYAYALIARYAKLDNQRLAYEWDDHGTFGWDKADSTTGSNNYKTMWPLPDSLRTFRAMLRDYGIHRMNTTGPADSLWLMATTWQNGKRYPELLDGTWNFVPHVHDTAEAHPLGMVLGLGSNSCGYSGNSIFHPRYAFRSDAALAVDQPFKYGIYNRIARQDSAYRAYFGSSVSAPYLSFPNDYSATPSIRRQKVTLGGNVLVFNPDCPPESLFAAYRAAGKRIIRGFVDLQNPYDTTFVDATSYGTGVSPSYAMWQDTVASLTTRQRFTTRYFSRPDQVFRGVLPPALAAYADNPNGVYSVKCVGTIAASQTGATIISASGTYPYTYQFRQAATTVTPTLLGLWFSPPHIANPLDMYGESALGGSFTGAKVFRFSQDVGRIRMFYQHPGSSQFATGSPWARFNPEKEIARVNVLSNIRALEGVAGHTLVQWVRPWEVFDK